MTGTIYTFGYIGRRPEELVAALDEHDALLVDIRYKPTSRAPQWRAGPLRCLAGEGRYHWREELGNVNYRSGGEIALADPARGIMLVVPLVEAGRSVVLLCACREAATCHRSLVADLLAEATGAPVVHLMKRDDQNR